jgi:UDP-GlcNAc:undecaprenyl-phosphate GlcNAc-1-phosphate transferase
MLVGLMLSAAATTATTNADPQGFNGGLKTLPLYLPLLIPLAVLAVPFIDLMLAVVRRVTSGHSPFAPDKRHLHHRLLELGHSHRRAVLLLYFWSALIGFGGAATAIFSGAWVLVVMIVAGVAIGVLLLVVPRLQARRRTALAKRRKAAGQPAPATSTTSADHLAGPGPQASVNGSPRRPEGDLSRPSAL